MKDISTVVWKELSEFWRARGGSRARLMSFLPIFFVFGVFWPLQGREAWVTVPFLPGFLFMILPLTLAGGTAADSFAGERERHTLETLLATRLSDRDIFAGKVLATTIYCTALVWACALISLITLNVSRGSNPIFWYSEISVFLIALGTPLLAVLMTAIGVLVSLRAATVRSAAQTFSIVTLLVFIGVPLLIQALPPAMQASLVEMVATANMTLVALAAGTVVLAASIALLALGIARFQRTRLILEE
jgi:ABC-2 type transport system permease protein